MRSSTSTRLRATAPSTPATSSSCTAPTRWTTPTTGSSASSPRRRSRSRGRRCSPDLLPERCFYRLLQAFQSEGHVLHGTVDEKPGRGPHPALRAAVDVFVHPLQIAVLLHLVVVAVQVQLRLQGVLPQVVGLEMLLVLEEQV